MMPSDLALSRILSRSNPAPSSESWMKMLPAWWNAFSVSEPHALLRDRDLSGEVQHLVELGDVDAKSAAAGSFGAGNRSRLRGGSLFRSRRLLQPRARS